MKVKIDLNLIKNPNFEKRQKFKKLYFIFLYFILQRLGILQFFINHFQNNFLII